MLITNSLHTYSLENLDISQSLACVGRLPTSDNNLHTGTINLTAWLNYARKSCAQHIQLSKYKSAMALHT